MQCEVNWKDFNNLTLERLGQEAINQNTELSKREPTNILKNQNDESADVEKTKATEKNIKMYEGNHDIKTSEPEDAQVEQLNNPDLQDSDKRNVNNKADVVLKNIKVQNTTELERSRRLKVISRCIVILKLLNRKMHRLKLLNN